MKYASDDGKIFDSEQECLGYERELKAIKEKEKSLAEEKQKRHDEMTARRKELQEYIEQFNKDYNTSYYIGTISSNLDKFFNIYPLL